jgi:hypothetical protein
VATDKGINKYDGSRWEDTGALLSNPDDDSWQIPLAGASNDAFHAIMESPVIEGTNPHINRLYFGGVNNPLTNIVANKWQVSSYDLPVFQL